MNSKDSNSDIESSLSDKYKGLLETSFRKRIQYACLELFQNINQIAQPFYTMHLIITFFRLSQFIMATYCTQNILFWGKNTLWYKALGILSCIAFIIPSQYRQLCAVYILLILSTVSMCFLFFCSYLYIHLRKTSQLSKSHANFAFIFIHSYGYVAQNLIATLLGEELSYMISGHNPHLPLSIFVFFYSAIFYLSLDYLLGSYANGKILITPNSLITVFPSTIHNFMSVISFLCGLTSYLSKKAEIVIFVVILFWICGCIIMPFFGTIFISRLDEKKYLCTCFIGLINILIIFFSIITNNSVKDITIIIFIAFIPISIIISSIWTKQIHFRCLKFLDDFENQVFGEGAIENVLPLLKPRLKILKIIASGLEFAHPVCLSNWKIFRDIIQIWPDNLMVWSMFAKYVAIYPEENSTLDFIAKNIIQIKASGRKHILFEIYYIQRSRERALSGPLKLKTSQFSQKLDETKIKMRSIWDLVLQGNLFEFEQALATAFHSTIELRTSLDRLMNTYPNNRFALRCHMRFINEIENNHEHYITCIDKMRSLQRGQQIVPDTVNQIGLHYYPNFPVKLDSFSQVENTQLDSEITTSEVYEIEDSQLTQENQTLLQGRIDELVIPNIKLCKIIYIVRSIIFLMLPIFMFILPVNIYTTSLLKPLKYVYYVANLRTRLYQCTNFLLHFIMENLNTKLSPIRPLVDPPNTEGLSLEGFNGHSDTRNQLKFSLRELMISIEELGGLRMFKASNQWLNNARFELFGFSIPFVFYQSSSVFHREIISLQDAISDFSKQISLALQKEQITEADSYSSITLDTGLNIELCSRSTNNALSNITEYIHDHHRFLDKIYMIAQISLSTIVPLITILSYFFIKKLIYHNFYAVFTTFSSLPKSIISSILENLKSIKKEQDLKNSSNSINDQHFYNESEETFKQAGNSLKFIRNIIPRSSKEITNSTLLISLILLSIGSCIIYLLIFKMYRAQNDIFDEKIPHIDYMIGSYGYQTGAVLPFFLMLFGREGYNGISISPTYIYQMTVIMMENAMNSYYNSRFGDIKKISIPNSNIPQSVKSIQQFNKCDELSLMEPTIDFKHYSKCMSPDHMISILYPLLSKQIHLIGSPYSTVRSFDQLYSYIYEYYTITIYEIFYYPMLKNIQADLTKEVYHPVKQYLPIIILVPFIIILGYYILFNYLNKVTDLIKFALKQLINFSEINCESVPKLANLLNGNFNTSSSNYILNEKILQKTIEAFPDPIILVNKAGTNKSEILSLNNAAKTLFGISQFDNHPDNSIESYLNTFQIVDNSANFDPFKNVPNQIVHLVKNENDHNLLYSLIIQKYNNSQFSFSFIDITEEARLLSEIEAQKERTLILLSTLIPDQLINRVFKSDKETASQEVQSAAIAVIGSTFIGDPKIPEQALSYMKSLSSLYSIFDSLLPTFSSTTKVKIIGEKYIIAGGLFTVVNQPQIHTKEVVQFCLEAVQATQNLINQGKFNGYIKIGINAGGPVFTGVIRNQKPSFEAIGIPVKIAEEIEGKSAPMQIQITRSVYELIYGGFFKVRERGEIEIRSGTIFTYIVSLNE